MKKIDLGGKRFGRLLVIKEGPKSIEQLRWWCQCDCGTRKLIFGTALKSGFTNSCGCLNSERSASRRTIHSESVDRKATKEYRAWQLMKARCYVQGNNRYHAYGARGIRVCERWLNNFGHFLADMGRAPSKAHSLDRVDVNGDYCPENCRWSTPVEQGNNKRTNIRVKTPEGDLTVAQLARKTGVSYGTLLKRAKAGWDYHSLICPP